MSRQSRARRARLWTMAGLTFLSGCSGAASDAPSAATPNVEHSLASCAVSTQTSLSPRHTLDAKIVPVWYPFEDPPMPALLPANGAAADSAMAEPPRAPDEPRHQPTVVLPSADADAFERLPPVDDSAAPENAAPEPPDSRYEVPSRYSIGSAAEQSPYRDSHDDASDPNATSRADNTEHERADNASLPVVAPPASEPSTNAIERPRDAFRRLPPVEHAPAVDANRVSEPAMQPQSSETSRNVRPSDVFADEARPIERFERLPLVDETPSRPAERIESSIVATPTYENPSYQPLPYGSLTAPQIAPDRNPIILPPVDASSPGDVGSTVEQTPLVTVTPPRHREMQLINDRAAEGVRAGFELAHRGALYSAQAEFAAALRVVAQALDAQENRTRHVECLAAGLTALEESDDFLAPARSNTPPIDVAVIVAKHRTPVLRDAPQEDLTPIAALQRYYTFAQEQLAAAAEHEPAASQALYGLGKVQTTLQSSRTGTIADGPKAIALHQAALLVDDRNFMAANELGVLMARCGRYDAARAALAHSVLVSPQPAVWRNLAAVHDRLGETALAANARVAAANSAHTAALPSVAPSIPQQPVVWLDPAAFAQSAQPQADLQRGQPAAAPTAAPSPVPQTSDRKSGFKWPLW